jgi:thioredoxin-like negative regulator of GroEL
MSKTIISEIRDRQAFHTLLQHNTGLIIIKFGAEWCGPCKLIQKEVDQFFVSSPPEVICCEIDVDKCFDVYAYLKSKKMINGIPAILCWKKGNETFIPDDSVTGADLKALHNFFIRCGNLIRKI